MRPTALLDYSDLTPEERELAERLATDGGRDEGEQAAGGAGGGGDDGGDDGSAFDVGGQYGRRQKIGLVLGPVLFVAIMLMPTPEGLLPGGQAVAATTAWVAVWWIGEATPIPATSLLPIVLFTDRG
jgi:sodium-dependent dicarboxylate transporter 2/3/5